MSKNRDPCLLTSEHDTDVHMTHTSIHDIPRQTPYHLNVHRCGEKPYTNDIISCVLSVQT
jgi:hypothetical protein